MVLYPNKLPESERVCSGICNEGREVEKLLMNNNPDDGVTGGATLWKLTQGITAFAREQQPERCRELHEISGQLMNRVKIN